MKDHFASLQAGRGLGALVVVLAHVTIFSADKLHWSYLGGAWNAATVVVDFFFVLSGFIIFYVHRDAIGVAQAAGRYFYRRTVRIYPLVIVLTALKVLYMFAHGSGFFPDQKRDLCYIISSTLLLPRNDPPFLEVSWPLGYEMLCYTLFALAILFGRRMVSLALPHAFCCLLLNLPFAPKFPLPIRFFFSPYVLEFYMGCLAAYIFLTRPPGRPVAVASIGLGVVLLVAGIIDYHSALVGSVSDLSHLYWGTGLFLIVLGIVVIENQTGSRAPRWLCFLGDASYSIYLSHTSVVVLVGFLIKQRLAALHPHLMIILSLLAGMGVLAGVLCYVYVERPLLKWLQGKAPRRQTAAAAAA